MSEQVTSLYVHIPFCERKCEYCDFASIAGLKGDGDYVARLVREIRDLGAASCKGPLETIFFGGGTPGLLDPALTEQVCTAIRDTFDIAANMEMTLEANPSSVTGEKIERWQAMGFNRYSIGVQSLDNDVLRFLGRVHTATDAVRAVEKMRAGGVSNLSCDLIYAVPGLGDELWLDTVRRVLELQPDHISAYELTFEEGTPLFARMRRGQVRRVADEVAIAQHWLAVDALGAAGFAQYEVSNFAKPRRECRHNLVYWRNGYYFAAGVGAHGHLPLTAAQDLAFPGGDAEAVALRYWNTRKLSRYSSGDIRDGCEFVTARQHRQEALMVGLRLNAGLVVDDSILELAKPLQREGLVMTNGGHISLTRRGQEVLNEIVTRLAA